MLKCSPEAFAKCPTRLYCGSYPSECSFTEGSDCDKFNRQVEDGPKTNADLIRSMSAEQLASHLYLFVGIEDRIKYCQSLPECNALLETEDGIPEEKCVRCLLRWLQQPAEGKGKVVDCCQPDTPAKTGRKT